MAGAGSRITSAKLHRIFLLNPFQFVPVTRDLILSHLTHKQINPVSGVENKCLAYP
jgi:hypothetical protein